MISLPSKHLQFCGTTSCWHWFQMRERERGIGKGLSLQVGASIDVDDEFVRISIRNRIDSFLHRSEMPLRCIQVHHYMPMSLRGGGFAPTLLLQQLQATVISCWTRNCLLQIINRLTNNHIWSLTWQPPATTTPIALHTPHHNHLPWIHDQKAENYYNHDLYSLMPNCTSHRSFATTRMPLSEFHGKYTTNS